jgi:SAM-dependent methyltransferase
MSTLIQSMSADSARGVDGLELLCPRCGGGMEPRISSNGSAFACSQCLFLLRCQDGIWRALPEERLDYFAPFMADYQMIRAAEGRGSNTAQYYLGLPYRDFSGNNISQWKIRACTFTYLKENIFRQLPSSARVLDLGAGNAWMSYRLCQLGFSAVAVDLLVNEQDGLGAAKHYGDHIANFFPCFQAESKRLPFASAQFDAIIFNASFHYAESYTTVLGEAMRCLKGGAIVIIADTPWYSQQTSGEQMLAERRAAFLNRFGTASNSVPSLEYLTDTQLSELEERFGIHWERHTPFYGIRWTMRPIMARLRRRREPARFRIYCARKIA